MAAPKASHSSLSFSRAWWTFWLLVLAVLSSCNGEIKPDTVDSIASKTGPSAVTVGSEHISAISAVVNGRVTRESSAPSDLIPGFQYSTSKGISSSNSTTIELTYSTSGEGTRADAIDNFTAGITGLTPNTTYYYRSFVRQNGHNSYGETLSFTTKAKSSMLETLSASEVGTTSARLNAKLDLTDVLCRSISYGFYWGTSSSSLNTYLKGGSRAQNAYSAQLTNVSSGTQYWYKAYLKVDGKTYYGAVMTFSTEGLTGIVLNKSSLTLNEGQTSTLTATVSPSDAVDKTLTWSSSNTAVATVNQTGKVTAVSKGTATITAAANDGSGRSASCAVTVKRLVSSITLNKASMTLYNGKTETLTATVNPSTASNTSVTWSSSSTSVATVSSTGVVTGVSGGSATITASASDGSGVKTTCAVTVRLYVTKITLNNTSLTLNEGQTSTLTATVSPSNAYDKTLTWSSSNISVATVDQTGKVTAVSGGKATITASANDGSGVKAKCTVMVPVNLSSTESANCYIVSSPGTYSFRTVKGNSSTSVGSVYLAGLIWDSFNTTRDFSEGTIISSVSYSEGYITFTTPSTLKNGNAVIAVIEEDLHKILWSWHIWVCSGYDPIATAQVYYNNAGTMMDRNLGATSATPGDVGAIGLLYQWGRKDPFPCRSIPTIDFEDYYFHSNELFNTTESAHYTDIDYSIQYPYHFILANDNNYDWCPSSSGINDSRWQSTKTIYDPCPPGWRVPDGGGDSDVWAKASGKTDLSAGKFWDSTNKGMNLSGTLGSAGSIWYPASGYIDPFDGELKEDTGYFSLWSCSPRQSLYEEGQGRAYYFHGEKPSVSNGNRSIVWFNDYTSKACGFSVRCVKE